MHSNFIGLFVDAPRVKTSASLCTEDEGRILAEDASERGRALL